jgi:anti-sigma regulatory factor (Ser/Thr protein kinase)
MTALRSWKSLVLAFVALASVWGALVTFFAAQFVLTGSLEWTEALRRSSVFWMPWVLLLPLTWGMTRWLLHRETPLAWSLGAHVLGCTTAVMACHLYTSERTPFRDTERPRDSPGSPAEMVERGDRPRDFQGPPPRDGGARPREFQGPPPGSFRNDGPGPPRQGRPPGRQGRPDEPGRPRNGFGAFGFRTVIDTVIYGGVVSMTCALAFLRRSRQRERRTLELEASLSRARLDALRLQINPHFLFNTLNAAASLVHSRPDAADEMIGSLSELLRASLQGTGSHEITLARELELLGLYTSIERTRFGERIEFTESIAPEARAALVPALVLQPLVENAVRHGLEPRPGPGKVAVDARREGGRLILTVCDDGIGFDPGRPARGSGIGLANTRDRIRALYGDAQHLTIAAAPRGGTCITISLPWHLP